MKTLILLLTTLASASTTHGRAINIDFRQTYELQRLLQRHDPTLPIPVVAADTNRELFPGMDFHFTDMEEVSASKCSQPDQALAIAIVETYEFSNYLAGVMCVPASQCKILVPHNSDGVRSGFYSAVEAAPITSPAHYAGLLEYLFSGGYVYNHGPIHALADGSSICLSHQVE